jgi:hypothetical protein
VDCINASFNARGLYHISIVPWAVHLMLSYSSSDHAHEIPTTVSLATIGADNESSPFLLLTKTLLKHVLSNYLDKKKDLQLIAEATIYTLRIKDQASDGGAVKVLQGAALVRVYLLRLLLELVLEGVDHLVQIRPDSSSSASASAAGSSTSPRASSGLSAFTSLFQSKRALSPPPNSAATPSSSPPRKGSKAKNSANADSDSTSAARAFLDVFATTLTPTWFACILESCREEASASIAFRLLILLLQYSPNFASKFILSSSFETFTLSIPKYGRDRA